MPVPLLAKAAFRAIGAADCCPLTIKRISGTSCLTCSRPPRPMLRPPQLTPRAAPGDPATATRSLTNELRVLEGAITEQIGEAQRTRQAVYDLEKVMRELGATLRE